MLSILEPGRNEKDSTKLIGLSLVASVVLEKICVPSSGGLLSCSLVVLLLLVSYLVIIQKLFVDIVSVTTLSLFFLIGIFHVIFNFYTRTSLGSLLLVSLVQITLVFRLREGACNYTALIRLFANLSAVCGAVGIAQFLIQFSLGSDLAFYLDLHVPSRFLVTGYNNLNPLYYGSSQYKPNGVFFLEPSYFNQLLAIGIVAELISRARVFVLSIIFTSMVLTYSGTGFLMLVVAIPTILIRSANYRLILIIVVIGAVLWPLADFFELGLIFNRAGEFADDQSSGFARFLGALFLLGHALSAVDGSLYFGRGPGTVAEYVTALSFVTFDPTWAKIIYEYGLCGAFFYITHFAASVGKGHSGLRVAIGFTYMVLGGYLADPTIVTLVATLAVWPRNSENAVATFDRTPLGGPV